MRTNNNIGILELHTGRLVNGARLATVDFTKLFFPDYQRDAISHHVKSIGANWNPSYARPLLINLRDRKLNTFDGRQTSTAAISIGITKGLAFVWDGWTYQQEAAAFFVFNDVPKQMNGWKKFDAARKAGNATNELILTTLHGLGLTTPFHPQVAHVGLADITSSRVVLEVMKKGGLPLLTAFGKTMKGWKANGVLPETAKAIDFGRGLRDFLFSNNNVETLRVLKIITPDQIRQVANGLPSIGRIDFSQIRQAMETLARTGRLAA